MPYKDPEKRKAKKREYDRRKRGTPLDRPVAPWKRYETKDEAVLARRRRERKYYAKAQGLTVEELDARIAARQSEQEARRSCPKVKAIKPERVKLVKSASLPRPAPTRSETTPASASRISRVKRPGLLTLRTLGKWWF